MFSTWRPRFAFDDGHDPAHILVRGGLDPSLAGAVDRELGLVEERASGGNNLGPFLHRAPEPALRLHHVDQRFGIGGQAVAPHPLGGQERVEAEGLAGQALARDFAHRRAVILGRVEREGTIGKGFRLAHQRQSDVRLDAQRPGIGAEQAGDIRAEAAQEMVAGIDHRSIGQHHLHRHHALHEGAVLPGAPEGAVLAHTPADAGLDARKRAPQRGAQAQRLKRLVQLLPAAPGLYRHGHVGLIDVQHAVHRAQVHQNRLRIVLDIAAGIAQPRAARDDGQAIARGGGDPGAQFLDRRRAQHRLGQGAAIVDVVAHRLAQGFVAQQGNGLGHAWPSSLSG
nr:hypothetical protein [Novosphingobium sp.]